MEPQAILNAMERVIVGKRDRLELVLASMLAGGHVLIEDVPGVAKTVVARTLARLFAMDFSRVQMTPDLLPADLTGTGIWDETTREFTFQHGPIFAQILLVDELNRATPRTQSGLLEAMEEHTVSADGQRHPLPEPFFVIATQNPLEQQGVFPLPEAQLDRFLIQTALGYPTLDDEVRIVHAQSRQHPLESLEPLVDAETVRNWQEQAMSLHTDASIMDYLVRLVRSTRHHQEIALGASPRASLGLHRLARALAFIRSEAFVTPDHVKDAAIPVLQHRICLHPQARLAGRNPCNVIEQILDEVQPPIYTEH